MKPVHSRSEARHRVIDATAAQVCAAMCDPAMLRAVATTVLLATAMASLGVGAATSIYKCTTSGKVTYQSDPCSSGVARKLPTVEQLNAERQRKLRQATGATTAVPLPVRTPVPTAANEPSERFTCDGRIYCSQMTSCEQAKYFLARCPGTKMDGDRDGIPCEQQWCR